MAKKTAKQCAYCGAVTHDWDYDHTVPQCLWAGAPLPVQMVTVRSCGRCNRYWSRHEGYFCSIFQLAARQGNHEVPKQAMSPEGRVAGHFVKDKAFRRSIVDTFRWTHKVNPDTGLWEGLQPGFQMQWDRVSAILGKMVRGLFYNEMNYPLPDDYGVFVVPGDGFKDDINVLAVLNQLSDEYQNFGGDDTVFMGRRGYDVNDANNRVYHLIFFKTIQVLAATMNDPPVIADDTSHPSYVSAQIAELDKKKQKWKP